jgi:hypothetical protein
LRSGLLDFHNRSTLLLIIENAYGTGNFEPMAREQIADSSGTMRAIRNDHDSPVFG